MKHLLRGFQDFDLMVLAGVRRYKTCKSVFAQHGRVQIQPTPRTSRVSKDLCKKGAFEMQDRAQIESPRRPDTSTVMKPLRQRGVSTDGVWWLAESMGDTAPHLSQDGSEVATASVGLAHGRVLIRQWKQQATGIWGPR